MSQEAFIGVLACARAADGSYPEEERSLVNLICQTHGLTRDLGQEGYGQIVNGVKSQIARMGWRSAMDDYLSRVPSEWAHTVLLSVIDICLIDANEDRQEHECVARVAGHFSIPGEHVDNFMQWFRVKHGHVFANSDEAVGETVQVA